MHNFVLHQSRCTNNCVFCRSRDFGDIETNVEHELRKLKEAITAGESIDEIEISGNDPGEYRQLPSVIRQLKQVTQARRIILSTHGKTLGELDFLRRLIEVGVTEFVVPLYGHTARLHEAVTRRTGSFVATLRGLENLRTLAQTRRITTLITRENQSELKEFFLFLATLTSEFSVGIPHYSTESFRPSIPDFELLKYQLSRALLAMHDRTSSIAWLRNIPYCMLLWPYSYMEESRPPKWGYEHLRAKGALNTGFARIVEGQVIPEYRVRSKTADCNECVYNKNCGGFYEKYMNAGLFRPVAIRVPEGGPLPPALRDQAL